MSNIDFKYVESKWQKIWLDTNCHKFVFNNDKFKNKKYILTMFSYPSGDKLHIGHWYNYAPVDTFARYLKMNGYNVFQPQGFDAFGLPAENYAIKNGIHPKESTSKNIAVMKSQLKKIGAMFSWENEVITSEPEYYKWTQWLFLQLYNNKLAYQKEAMVNWDPVDQTVLANEQVLSDGTSDSSGAKVIQKPLKQWFFRITKYADRLLNFENLYWPKKTILMQKNWIGKSEGATVDFQIDNTDQLINVFTTRPDTLFGCTYIVLAPEHPIVKQIVTDDNKNLVIQYINHSTKKNELQRTDLNIEKTGIFTGTFAINPVNKKKIPLWIADYVIATYGTGAIMAVPGHDQRDYDFAKKYNLDIIKVVDDNDVSISDIAFSGSGICINSDFLDGLKTEDANKKIISWLKKNKCGEKSINYRLRDWLISRQRYWGTPIPIVYDPKGNTHPVPEKYLPWLLPNDVEYMPKGTSPLGSSKELIKRTEKIFGKGWKPEIDTMDTFVCSSWYYLRYPDSKNNTSAFTDDSNRILPVDHYIGGSEHATMHLLYARFITKCLKDLKYVSFDEPFINLYHQGTITKNGSKMSKSKGNTVSPDIFIDEYGADTFRCYLMFMGPFDEGGDWNDKGITGISRFLKRTYKLIQNDSRSEINDDDEYILNATIKYISENLKEMKFNTSLSKLMEFVNHFYEKGINLNYKKTYIKLLAPFAPHLCEELWEGIGETQSIFNEKWPSYNDKKIVKEFIDIAIQVNGKLRGTLQISTDMNNDDILSNAKNHKNVKNYLEKTTLIKEIYIPGKIINFVVN